MSKTEIRSFATTVPRMSSKLLSRTTLRTALLPIFFVAIQWVTIPLLWSQQSDQGVLFGRYSARYALVLAANLIAC